MPRAPAIVHYTDSDGSSKLVAQDAMTREAPAETAIITDNPVERGSPATDNIRRQNGTLTLEIMVSNTPLQAPQSHANGVTSTYSKAEGSGVVLAFSDTFDRVRAVYADLLRVESLGLLFDIVTSLRDYHDYAIESLNCERTNKTGDAARFVLGLKQVRFVNTAAAAIPRRVPRVRPVIPAGATPPTPTPVTLAHHLAVNPDGSYRSLSDIADGF